MSEYQVTLHMPADLSADLSKHSGLYAFVQDAFPEIDSRDTAALAAEQRKECVTIGKAIKERMDAYTAPAEQIIEQARADFRPAIENAKAAAQYLGDLLIKWESAEKKRIDALRREQEEADRQMRAKAEQDAAAARAKAQAEAEEKRRLALVAEEKQRQALADGNAKAAATAAEESARRAAEAQEADDKAATEATRIQLEAEAKIAATSITETSKVVGFGSRKNWKAQLAPGYTEESAMIVLIKASDTRPELLAFLTIDMATLHRQAKALEGNFNVPGFVARNVPVATSR